MFDCRRRQDGCSTPTAGFAAVDRATEMPMVILSVIMVPLILVPLLLDLSQSIEDAMFMADWAIWAVFALELGVNRRESNPPSS